MFWTGFFTGLFIGASVGILVAALFFMFRLREKAHERLVDQWTEKKGASRREGAPNDRSRR